jgi:hypothetical protein
LEGVLRIHNESFVLGWKDKAAILIAAYLIAEKVIAIEIKFASANEGLIYSIFIFLLSK